MNGPQEPSGRPPRPRREGAPFAPGSGSTPARAGILDRDRASAGGRQVIPRGLDHLTTVRSERYVELHPELLGPGLEWLREMVVMVGARLFPPMGNADAIVERLTDGEIGQEIPTRLVAFANVSAAPLKLEGHGAAAGYHDLYVTLSPSADSPGRIIYRSEDGIGGTFESQTTFWPLFELRPLGGGRSIFVDTGRVSVPGFPMTVEGIGGAWSRKPDVPDAVRAFRSRGIFYIGEVVLTARRAGQSAAFPMGGTADPIARCAMIQAQFVTAENPGRLSRINFPHTKAFANVELE